MVLLEFQFLYRQGYVQKEQAEMLQSRIWAVD